MNILTRARGMAEQLEKSAAVIRELCDAMETAGVKISRPEMDVSVLDIEWSVRTRKMFYRAGIQTFGHLTERSAAELLVIHNFGRIGLCEVVDKLEVRGLKLRREDE